MGILDDIQQMQMNQVQQGAQQQGFAAPAPPQSPDQPVSQIGAGAQPQPDQSQPSSAPGGLQEAMSNYAGWLLQKAQGLQQYSGGAGNRFKQGVAAAAAHQAGIPSDYEAQLQNFGAQDQALKTAVGVQQSGLQSQMVTMMTPSGPMQVPLALAKTLFPASVRAQATVDAAAIKSSSQIKMIDGMPYVKGENGFQPVPVNGLQKILIDKQTADAANTPQFAGQELPFKQAMGVIKLAQGANGNITTGEGVFRQNKTTGELGQRLGSAPQVAAGAVRAQQNAYWQAKYGVVQSVDADGNPQYISRLDAPGSATATGAMEMFKGKAGLANYSDALTRIKSTLPVLEDPEQRALVARTLRSIGTNHDPGIISAFLGNAVSSGLSEQGADLVAATLQGREFIGANRQYAGNFRGSEQLYQRMVANLPGPQNSTTLNQKLVDQDIANTGRIQGSIKKFQGGAKNGGATGQFTITDPSGKLQSFSSQGALDRFKKLAGIK